MQTVTEKPRGALLAGNLDTAFLKVLALLFMLIDHIGATLLPGVPELRIIGRMAFPLYCWCLVVGSEKTRHPLRYGLRLLILGVVSQPLYMMALSHGWADLNILFSLTVGLIAIVSIQKRWMGSQFWGPVACYVLLGFLRVDYGWQGLTFILVLYLARNNRSGLVGAYLAYAFYWGASSSPITHLLGNPLTFLGWPGIGRPLSALFHIQSMVWLSLPLVAFPTHTKLKMPQWLGYALYPMHLILLIFLKILLQSATLTSLTAWF